MARKSVKRELVSRIQPENIEGHQLISSGDAIGMNSDATMADGLVEAGNPLKQPLFFDVSNFPGGLESRTSDGGLQVLGRGVKELVQAVQELRHLGVEDLVLPLPKIVVVGDQSTGKSSLIEGISGIKVPRSAGCCTRCPLEINLTESTGSDECEWTCSVSLYKKYNYEGNLGTGRVMGKTAFKFEGATRTRPLGPWTMQDSEDFHFATVTSKNEVEHVLYLAQLATLNPGSPYERYLPGNPKPKDERQVKFSPNVVRLDISGPGLPNLSFTDLPGVINVSDEGEDYLISLVKNLVKEYVKADDCINLLAMPMTHDPANSSAARLVREVRAESRTVGCLTKPDRREESESLEQWIEMLNGERFRLGFGYHVIKNNPDPGVDHATARKEEETFFAQEPWTTSLGSYADRFGTLLLQTALSQRLTAQIRSSLPRIIDQVLQKAEDLDARLRELPEPLGSNLPAIVMGELKNFERELEKHFDGGCQAHPFQKKWHLLAMKFRKDLADSRPVLVFPILRTPSQPSQSNGDGSIPGTPTPFRGNTTPIPIDSDDDDPSPISQRSGQKRPFCLIKQSPKKMARTITDTAPSAKQATSKRFDLFEVRNIIQDAYIGLPNQTDPKATERMIILSMAHWEEPVDSFLNGTKELCETMIFEQIQKVFGKYAKTLFYDKIMQICESFFEKVMAQQRQLVLRVLSWEISKPKTFNEEALELASEKALTLLQTKRHEIRATTFLDEQEAKTGKTTSGQARVEKASKITDATLGPDLYAKEIRAMSIVKGYYECAYSRFVDVVCASVHCELFAKCRDGIVREMKQQFGVTEDGAYERFAVLMAANPRDEERRVQLQKERDTIQKAQERLEGLSSNDLDDLHN